MYVSQVKIKNYRNFREFIAILSPLTVIVGENESGKTNFFAALSLALSGNDLAFNQKRLSVSDINTISILDFYSALIAGKVDSELRKLIPKVSVDIEIEDPKSEYEEALLRKWLKPDSNGYTYGIRYDFKPRDDDELIAAAKAGLVDIETVEDARWFTLPTELYEYRVVSTNNEKPISSLDLKNIVINSIAAERDDFSEANTMKSNSLLTRILVNSLKDQEKAAINNAYVDFFKNIEDTESFKSIINLDPELINLKRHIEDLKCIPNIPNLKNILSNITLQAGNEFLFQRGLGKRNLIYLILLFEFYRSDKRYFNLCCIEEPEAHLGVNNLKLATDFIFKSTKLNNTRLQTLVTSHNPTVINKLELSNVVVFSGDRAVPLKETNDELVNYLRKRPNFDILKLLFANRVLLVEGPTEEMLINSLLTRTTSELLPVEVIAIGQKGFKSFLDIWLQVNKGNESKRIGVVRDYDSQDNAKREHHQYEADNLNIRVRTTHAYTLENDLVSAGDNRRLLSDIYGLAPEATIEIVSAHMIEDKANSMLTLCDAILRKNNPLNITFPDHIKDVIEFLT